MHTIAVLTLVTLATTSLALIHETRLWRAANGLLCRLARSLGRSSGDRTAHGTSQTNGR